MLTIRLQRMGKKSQPSYRLIISEKAKATNSSVLEYLGHYHPASKDKQVVLKEDRIKFWIGKGAGTSETVNNILVNNGVIEGKKVKAFYIPTKAKKAKEEKIKKAAADAEAKKAKEAQEKEEAKKAKEAEEAAAKEAANVVVAETPTEEAPQA